MKKKPFKELNLADIVADYDRAVIEDPMLRRRRRVVQSIRKELKRIGDRYGVEIFADSGRGADYWGYGGPSIQIKTLREGGRGKARKLRMQEDARAALHLSKRTERITELRRAQEEKEAIASLWSAPLQEGSRRPNRKSSPRRRKRRAKR